MVAINLKAAMRTDSHQEGPTIVPGEEQEEEIVSPLSEQMLLGLVMAAPTQEEELRTEYGEKGCLAALEGIDEGREIMCFVSFYMMYNVQVWGMWCIFFSFM